MGQSGVNIMNKKIIISFILSSVLCAPFAQAMNSLLPKARPVMQMVMNPSVRSALTQGHAVAQAAAPQTQRGLMTLTQTTVRSANQWLLSGPNLTRQLSTTTRQQAATSIKNLALKAGVVGLRVRCPNTTRPLKHAPITAKAKGTPAAPTIDDAFGLQGVETFVGDADETSPYFAVVLTQPGCALARSGEARKTRIGRRQAQRSDRMVLELRKVVARRDVGIVEEIEGGVHPAHGYVKLAQLRNRFVTGAFLHPIAQNIVQKRGVFESRLHRGEQGIVEPLFLVEETSHVGEGLVEPADTAIQTPSADSNSPAGALSKGRDRPRAGATPVDAYWASVASSVRRIDP